ncbi:hypothetical protein C5E08_06330 [Rathayibacter iranicus]|uniref:Uncharacterized protein n=2 Tax=Rathayibacter iranicus TaxID=59737 RepID=A0AAD1EMB9_9MICO|nr:hypothetical protein C7V51_06350 [Rathayibacter iranicus]PPI48335.1 hypothetical protein C5E09_05425 [Rathayibacter iranicus]PPI60966.1 hypothetical protein C5E08_06330 [Rathayibacter iranicus]PWJ63199.1 hypothetical protein B0H03_1082 [Rathayibacter iranicus NCPPB 2253 = VKM Ac-1602]
MMGSDTRVIRDGFHEETRTVSALTSRVAGTSGGGDRIASSGAVAQTDTNEFDQLGVNIEVQHAQDAQGGEVSE